MVDICTHYRTTTEGYPTGVYRVVGTGDPVALLRVADVDGRRRHTGHLERVPRSELADHFEPADDPDASLDPVGWVVDAVRGLYWRVRNLL